LNRFNDLDSTYFQEDVMESLIVASYILKNEQRTKANASAEDAFYRSYTPGRATLLPPLSALAAVMLYAAGLGWLPG
jgi:hypothetical protein